MRRAMLALALAVPLAAATATAAQAAERTAVKEGFRLPAEGARILVFRPDVSVGAQSTAGLDEPNAEWTETARRLLAAELTRTPVASNHQMVFLPDYEGEQAELVNDYRQLFRAVTGAVIRHQLFPGDRLPTKRRDSDRLDYTMGQGTRALAELGGGDYGLFFYTQDSYGTTGRKVLQILALGLGAGFVPSGVHVGYAGLVDLRTGDLVWINVDTAMGGDVRTEEGATKRVRQLLEEFPASPGTPLPDGTATMEKNP